MPPPDAAVALDDAAPVPDDADIARAAAQPRSTEAAIDAGPERSPQERLIREIASGAIPLAEAVDPEVGVVSIRYEGRAGDMGAHAEALTTISRNRLCGAALERAFPSLRSDLAEVVRSADEGPPMRCAGDECVASGEGSDPAWRLRFNVSVDLPPRVELVARVSETTMSDAWVARARAYVQRALTGARTRPCSQACRSSVRDAASRVHCIVNVLGPEGAVRAHGYLGLAELATEPGGDVTQTMRAYLRRFPSSPLASHWRGYLR